MGVLMRLTASRLRQDICRILDRILETGLSVEIERRGRLLRITPVDPEEIVHIDWSDEWRP